MNEDGQRWGRKMTLPRPSLPSLSSVEVNRGVAARPDAGVLIAVDRSSKQRLCAAESAGVSLWVKDRSFTC